MHTHTHTHTDPQIDTGTMVSAASAYGEASEMFPDLLQGGAGPHGEQEEQGQADTATGPPGHCKHVPLQLGAELEPHHLPHIRHWSESLDH